MAAEFSVVGKSVTRIDARPKVTGEAKFAVDMQLPKMLHMKLLRSPHPSARIKNIDMSKAESLKGVAAVVTHLEFNGKKLGFGGTPGVVYDDRMRYVGEAVVAVAAENADIAEAAANLVKVDYEVLPAVFDIEEAMKPEAIKVHPGGNLSTGTGPKTSGYSFHWEKGDVEQGFKDADKIVERKMKTHSQYHAPHEGLSCIMSWEAAADKLTAWVSSQGPFEVRQSLAALLKLPLTKTRVISPYVGGAHGNKGGASAVFKEWQMAALLSRKTGRPVKYEQTREECVTTTIRRGSAVFHWKVGAKQDGTITAIEVSALREAGAYGSSTMALSRAVVDYVVSANFRCPNIREDGNSVFTNTCSTGAYRGFGYFEGNASFAPVIDELTESLGMDPVDFHLKNIFKAGEPVGSTQQPLSSSALDLGIQACAEKISWKEKRHKPGTKTMPNGKKHGIGLGMCVGMAYKPNEIVSSVVKIEADGKARVFIGATELGQGQSTGQVQMAAEALGMPFEDVSITFSDTENTPYAQSQTASSSTVCCGWPTVLAAQDAKRRLLQAAAAKMKKTVDELDTKDGLVFVKEDPGTSMTFADAMKGKVTTIIGHGTWFNNGTTDPAFRQPEACMCEVEVDTETGIVDITNLVVAVDCGRVISPKRVECQFQNILSGGRGYVLAEEPVWSAKTGRILNPSWLDYKLSTTLDTGPGIMQSVIIVDTFDPYGPLGAKGAGEAGIAPSAGALLNAIYNAIAVRPDRIPVTPDVILRALAKV